MNPELETKLIKIWEKKNEIGIIFILLIFLFGLIFFKSVNQTRSLIYNAKLEDILQTPRGFVYELGLYTNTNPPRLITYLNIGPNLTPKTRALSEKKIGQLFRVQCKHSGSKIVVDQIR